MSRTAHLRLAGLGAFLILTASCATINQSVVLAPLETPYPVSASQSLVAGGTVVTGGSFRSSEVFQFKKTLRVPYTATSARLALEDELGREVAAGDYSGVTQLKIDVLDVDNSTGSWIAIEQNIGAVVGFAGLGFLSISAQLPADQGGGNYVPGLVTAGVGGLIYGLSYVHRSVGTVNYSFGVTGVKVKF